MLTKSFSSFHHLPVFPTSHLGKICTVYQLYQKFNPIPQHELVMNLGGRGRGKGKILLKFVVTPNVKLGGLSPCPSVFPTSRSSKYSSTTYHLYVSFCGFLHPVEHQEYPGKCCDSHCTTQAVLDLVGYTAQKR